MVPLQTTGSLIVPMPPMVCPAGTVNVPPAVCVIPRLSQPLNLVYGSNPGGKINNDFAFMLTTIEVMSRRLPCERSMMLLDAVRCPALVPPENVPEHVSPPS